MKKSYQLFALICLQICFINSSKAQNVLIPDANFKTALLANYLVNTNADGEIQVSEAQAFSGTLIVSYKSISNMSGIEAFTAITSLSCNSNQLTSLDLSANISLTSLTCNSNQLTSLDLSANINLTYLNCYSNQLTSLVLPTTSAFTSLHCYYNQLTSIDLTGTPGLTELQCFNNFQLNSLDLSANTALKKLYCSNTQMTLLDLTANTLLEILECNNAQVASLIFPSNSTLTSVKCWNNQITSLDLTASSALITLWCHDNQLSSLLTANPALITLKCHTNQLTSLDVSANTALKTLECEYNQLTSLDLITNTALTSLSCHHNQLTLLNLSANTLLGTLSCSNNQISGLDLSQNTALTFLSCANNQLTSLDLRVNTALTMVACQYNLLNSLDLRNGNNTLINSYNSIANPNLSCISVDDPVWSSSHWTNINPQMEFSSNCGCGVFSINIDSLSNMGCQDSVYVRASVSGNNGPYQYEWLNAPLSMDSILIADTAIFYTLKVTDANLCESFREIILHGPKVTTGFELNTNLQAGIFQPGRLTTVNLSALNDGCVVQNAQLKLIYNGPLSFESSSIPPTSQNGDELLWDLGNMEYSISDFLANINFRTDTLAQAGDLNCFELSITPLAGDADSSNNTQFYCYTVVNSYDPNDLQVYPQGICAENYTLKNETLTYTVRFQNTGNAPAIDVSVIDSLSPYLNINSLRVISSSHEPLITEVLGNRTIKFNFYDINLADSLSDEEASKGYVTFQIDPYTGLNENTLVENTVGIYFDFNPPVITNTTHNTLVSILPAGDTTVIYDTLYPNYTFAHHSYSEAGIYHRYFTNQTGCDSLVVLYLAEPLPSYGTDVQTACGTYTWIDGNTYTSSTNTPTFILIDAASSGGDSIVTLHLTVNYASMSTISETVCESYTAPDAQLYTSSGTYTAVIPNSQGCDSTITINLTVNSTTSSTISETVCGTYTAPDAQLYTSSGIYSAVIPNAQGCDSTITINLTVNNSTSSTISETVCGTYTAPDAQLYTSSGTYTAVIPNSNGCDSTITINLTVNSSTSSTISETVCGTYTAPDAQVYTSSGIYSAMIPNSLGCDSTITINLTVNNSTSATLSETVCGTYTAPDAQVYTSSGTYTAVIPNSNGCDSTITINLTVNSIDNEVINNSPSLQAVMNGATYQWLDCGNNFEAIDGETAQTFTASENGLYAVQITQNNCIDTSDCILVDNLGINLIKKGDILIFPNPGKGNFMLDFGKELTNASLVVIDVLGREVYREDYVNGAKRNILLNQAQGVYQLVLRVSNDEIYVMKLMIE